MTEYLIGIIEITLYLCRKIKDNFSRLDIEFFRKFSLYSVNDVVWILCFCSLNARKDLSTLYMNLIKIRTCYSSIKRILGHGIICKYEHSTHHCTGVSQLNQKFTLCSLLKYKLFAQSASFRLLSSYYCHINTFLPL